MTENEIIHHIESLFTQMFDRMDNVEGRMRSMEKDFMEYCEHNPKLDEQWAEERLRKLEADILVIKDGLVLIRNSQKDIVTLDEDLHAQLKKDIEWVNEMQTFKNKRKAEKGDGGHNG